MPSTYSVSKRIPFDSSTVMTPSLPTLSMTSAIRLPISGSAAEIAAIWPISCLPLIGTANSLIRATTTAVALSIPFLRSIGLAPAATLRRPSLTMACARTVAVVVPSPSISLVLVAAYLSSCAPMFSNGSGSSTSRATVTPSWLTVGDPHFLPIATLRPLGPSVVLTASARISTPRLSERRACSSKMSCLAGMLYFLPVLADDGKNICFFDDQVLFVVDLVLGTGVLGVQNAIANFDVHGNAGAIVVNPAGAGGDDGSFLGLLFRGVR